MSACAPPLVPQRVLLHPLWLSSLLLLVLNDHVLKGAGLLPTVVTGKLSDFAGLLVAPALFAALVGVRSSRGWWLTHAAVGVVFSAIQVSPEIAALWSQAMAAFGVPWVIVCDPSDLIALPMLLLGGRNFARAMRRTAVSNLRRSGEWTAVAVGLASCIATSAPEGFWFADIFADVYLHNASDRDLVVRVRTVTPSIDYDCDAVSSDPGRLLQASVFGPGSAWSLRAGANMTLLEHGSGERECYAVLVDVDDFPPVVVFWRDGQPRQQWVSGEGIDSSAPGSITLDFDEHGRGRWDNERDLVHVRSESREPAEARCMPPSDASRLDWSTAPVGSWTLVSVEAGIDGCLELTLESGDPLEPGLQTERWYLCVPSTLFVFEPGDELEVERMIEGSNGWVDAVRLRELVVDRDHSDEVVRRELVVARGTGLPVLFGLDVSLHADLDCPWVAQPNCGTVTRQGTIAVASPDTATVWLRAGEEPKSVELSGGRVDVMVAHASERAVLNPECALGADSLGLDIEIVAAMHGAQ
jgi:hypothetical protein